MNKLLCAVLTTSLAFVAACDAIPVLRGSPDNFEAKDDEYVETATPISGVDIDALWERAQAEVAMDASDVDTARSRFSDHLMVTHWKTFLSPNRYEGRRNRAWVRFRQGKPGAWTIGVAVQQQRNADIDHPTEPGNAKWEEQPANKERAGLLLWKIESGFRDASGADAK